MSVHVWAHNHLSTTQPFEFSLVGVGWRALDGHTCMPALLQIQIKLKYPNKKFEHQGIKVEFIGLVGAFVCLLH